MFANLMRGARFVRGLLPVAMIVGMTGLVPVASAAENSSAANLPLPIPLPPLPLPPLPLPPLPLPPLPLPVV